MSVFRLGKRERDRLRGLFEKHLYDHEIYGGGRKKGASAAGLFSRRRRGLLHGGEPVSQIRRLTGGRRKGGGAAPWAKLLTRHGKPKKKKADERAA